MVFKGFHGFSGAFQEFSGLNPVAFQWSSMGLQGRSRVYQRVSGSFRCIPEIFERFHGLKFQRFSSEFRVFSRVSVHFIGVTRDCSVSQARSRGFPRSFNGFQERSKDYQGVSETFQGFSMMKIALHSVLDTLQRISVGFRSVAGVILPNG